MPFVKLSIGEARIGVFHVEDLFLPGFNGMMLRGTKVKLTLPNGSEVESRSICKPNDQFNRRLGRIMAARRLNSLLRLLVSKKDRSVIFKAICPEYRVGYKQRHPVKTGFMDKVDFDYEAGVALGGVAVYPDAEDVLKNRKCAKECGIVEVEIRLKRIVQEENFPKPTMEPSPSSTQEKDQ